ncbi:hypothetical protein M758_UG179200 [Ceratodon purpureus]|nr:hypothetical protein M758_UG179200 [Ceratodon purpureus]
MQKSVAITIQSVAILQLRWRVRAHINFFLRWWRASLRSLCSILGTKLQTVEGRSLHCSHSRPLFQFVYSAPWTRLEVEYSGSHNSVSVSVVCALNNRLRV